MLRPAAVAFSWLALLPPVSDSNYLPLATSNEWTYRVTVGGTVNPDRVVMVKDRAEIKGSPCFEISGFEGITLLQAIPLHLASGADGVVAVDAEKGPWVTLLRLPAPRGAIWNETRDDESGSCFRYRSEGEERIEVPAGVYTCLKVVLEDVQGKASTTFCTTWYAKDVGIVKSAPMGPLGKPGPLYELKSFSKKDGAVPK